MSKKNNISQEQRPFYYMIAVFDRAAEVIYEPIAFRSVADFIRQVKTLPADHPFVQYRYDYTFAVVANVYNRSVDPVVSVSDLDWKSMASILGDGVISHADKD